jgi:hypothetical protein
MKFAEAIMATTLPSSTCSQNWRDLYLDALLETNLLALPSRIDQADAAINLREADLSPGDNIEERQAMDDALYALRALRHSLELKTVGQTDQIVRCPYCVLSMLPKRNGWFVCQKCGHSTNLENRFYKCPCQSCRELNRAA